ncbi:MAG: hypothetical protein ACTHJ3_08895 [Pararhizobium sp.]
MGLEYRSLDGVTRSWMLQESALGGHYQSPRLTPAGLAAWVNLFNHALEHQHDDWLSGELIRLGHFRHEESYTRNGVTRMRAINIPSSALMLAEGEFNRFYLRGVCRRAADEGRETLTIYRGKAVSNPRPESEAKIGTQVSATDLLAALRSADFVSIDAAFAIPSGPNSGLTAWLAPV